MYLKRAAKRPWYVRDDSQFRPAGRRHLRAPASPRQRSLHSMCALLPFLLSPAFSGKENTQVAYGFKLQESSTKSAESCARLCENFTSHVMGTEHDCEAWTFDTKGLCTLRQLTGKSFISHVGDLTAVSWKRHANFKNDCTPLVRWQPDTRPMLSSLTRHARAAVGRHCGKGLPPSGRFRHTASTRSFLLPSVPTGPGM